MYNAIDRFEGSVADIQRAIDQRQQDLALDGPVRVQWSITSGQASAVGVVATDQAHPELNRCYASVLRRVVFPEELTGTMVWSFTADRRTARP